MLEVDPASGLALQNLGILRLRQERYADAETTLRRAIALDASLSGAYTPLGVALSELGRLDEAIEAWQRAVTRGRERLGHPGERTTPVLRIVQPSARATKATRAPQAGARGPRLARHRMFSGAERLVSSSGHFWLHTCRYLYIVDGCRCRPEPR
jgi:tetratricopeptide (TPR) repeat protein